MLLVKFIRKSSVRFFGDDLLSLSARGGVRHRGGSGGSTLAILVVVVKRVSHNPALVEIILHQPVKESRLRLSRVECFARRKKEKEGKRKGEGEDENFCSTMVKRTGGNRRIDEAPSMYIHWKSRANLFL